MTGDQQLAIGLMSGTSVDGIDGVLLRIAARDTVTIEARLHLPFADDVRTKINALLNDGTVTASAIGELHAQLGECYARAANQLIAGAKSGALPTVIGCHGQTIHHQPAGEFPFSLQLGNGAIVAARTGIATVTDFRSADIAAGGQGAPFAPAFHRAVFADDRETRAVLNLGGIANVTHLPAGDTGTVTGFDTGPANTLMDNWCQRHFDVAFDDGGKLADAARVNEKLLAALLADEYFARAAPKSTGREYFNLQWLDAILTAEQMTDLPPADVLATLTALTADSIAMQLSQLTPSPDAIYVCGGGVHNRALMSLLSARCETVRTTAELGIAPQWVEACAFAWLAHQTFNRAPSTLPTVTGATRATVAGAIYFPH